MVCDKRRREEFNGLVETLERRGMSAVLGPDYLERLGGADIIFRINELKYSFSIESIDNRTSQITVLRAGPIPQIYIVAIIPHPNPS